MSFSSSVSSCVRFTAASDSTSPTGTVHVTHCESASAADADFEGRALPSAFILRRNARMALVQLATQRILRGKSSLEEFVGYQDAWGWGAFDGEVLGELYTLLMRHWDEGLVRTKSAVRWDWERMCPVLRGIILCATLELQHGDVDIRVVVSEYVAITGAFYPEEAKESAFVKGVINAIGRGQRDNNQV